MTDGTESHAQCRVQVQSTGRLKWERSMQLNLLYVNGLHERAWQWPKAFERWTLLTGANRNQMWSKQAPDYIFTGATILT